MHILIRGANFHNKGAEAMLRTVQLELGRRLKGSSFHLYTSQAEVQYAKEYGLLPSVLVASRLERLFSPVYSVMHKLHFSSTAKAKRLSALEISNLGFVDAVIDVSGFAYSDECAWGPYRAVGSCEWVEYCRQMGKLYFCLPQAWGPFSKTKVAHYTKKLCENASAIYARDKESFNHLTDLLNDAEIDIKMSPDIAFRFQGTKPEAGAALLDKLGLELGKRTVIGLSPNMRVYEQTSGTGANNAYVQLMVRLAEYCMREIGAFVVIVPHELTLSNRKDDRFLGGLIRGALKNKENCIAMEGVYSTEIIKSVISHFDLLVGSRFHSLVLSLSSTVPSIALGWSHKYLELFRTFELEDYVCTYASFDVRRISEMLGRAWNDRDHIKHLISEHLPAIESEVDAVFDYVANLIIRLRA